MLNSEKNIFSMFDKQISKKQAGKRKILVQSVIA